MHAEHPATSIVARFEVAYTQYLGADGVPVAALPDFAQDADLLRRMYRTMAEVRAFDQKAVTLQRTGQMGTYASCLGQEAVGTAIGLTLKSEDIYVPAYRDYAAQFLRGVPMRNILQCWGGDERGMRFPENTPAWNDFPICVPIATHVPQAVGVAYAVKLRQQKRVVLASCGDGATSKGDFAEAISAAKVWNLPLVFVVSNNQWAISLPRAQQSGAQTLAQKAVAGGFAGEQVDGNDVIALHAVLQRAIEQARSGGGPRLIEAVTYRLHDHTTADDARRYRPEEEVKEAWQRCPLKRLKAYLENKKLWSVADEVSLQAQAVVQAEAAAQEYLSLPPEPASALFDSMYAQWPKAFAAQREELNSAQGQDHA